MNLLKIYAIKYDNLSEDQKKKVNVLNRPGNLTIDFVEDNLPPMSALEGDEEVKLEPEETIAERIKLNPRKRKNKGTRLKILTPNKLLTRLPILLAQIKAGNSSYKLKNGIRQILHLLYQHSKIPKKVYNKLINFEFDWHKDFDENLEHEIEFIIKAMNF